MKKLFLTSGVILCLACPAFAENGPYDINNDTNHSLQGADPAANASCQYPTLGAYTGPKTFFAKWAPHVFTVTYKPFEGQTYVGSTPVKMGEDAATDQVTKAVFDDEYVVYTNANFANAQVCTNIGTNDEACTAGTPLTKRGYNFAGWKSDYNLESGNATPSGTPYSASSDTSVDPYNVSEDNVIMYAQWTPQHYSMTYNSGLHGHASTVEESNAAHGATYTDPVDIVFDDIYTVLNLGTAANDVAGAGCVADYGYTFAGWSATSASESATSQSLWQPGEMSAAWTETSGKTLYAIYSAKPHTLVYDCGSVTVALDNTTKGGTFKSAYSADANHIFNVVFDQVMPVSLPTASDVCELAGYHVDPITPWTCTNTGNPNETIARNLVEGQWKTDVNVTCTVNWVANTIGLSWNVGQGATANSTTPGANSCTYDSTIGVAGAPTKAGYDFQGWTTNPAATGAVEPAASGSQPADSVPAPAQQGGGEG